MKPASLAGSFFIIILIFGNNQLSLKSKTNEQMTNSIIKDVLENEIINFNNNSLNDEIVMLEKIQSIKNNLRQMLDNENL